MIETIIANGTTIPPIIIIQGKQHMESWYSSRLEKGVRVVLSDSGYTNKEISLIYLDHIILHTNARLDKPLKVLFINRHSSYINPKFTLGESADSPIPQSDRTVPYNQTQAVSSTSHLIKWSLALLLLLRR